MPVIAVHLLTDGGTSQIVSQSFSSVGIWLLSRCNLAILDGPSLGEALQIADGNVEIVAETFHTLRSREVHDAINMLLVSLYSSGAAEISFFLSKCFPTVATQISGMERVLPLMGKVHQWMHATRKRIALNSVSDTAMSRYSSEQISAVSAMNIIKRDALILLGFHF